MKGVKKTASSNFNEEPYSKNTAKCLSHCSKCPGWDSNRTLHKYRSEALLLIPACLVS
jgi:hypothetical protein